MFDTNNKEENTYNQRGYKAKTIYEVAYLKMLKIPVIKEIQYERKRVFFFDDENEQSTRAVDDFYSNDFHKYAMNIEDVRGYLFENLNKFKNRNINNI